MLTLVVVVVFCFLCIFFFVFVSRTVYMLCQNKNVAFVSVLSGTNFTCYSQTKHLDPVVQLVVNLTLRYLYRVVKYSNDVLLNLTLKLCCSTKFYRIVS